MSYEQLEILKSGARGTISLVYDTERRQVVVRKRLQGTLDIYRQLKRCSHPYIPKLYEVHFAEDETVILEEYIPGGSPGQIHATEKQITQWLLECCDVLSFLHRNGILHRDIKPSNLLIGEDGHIRLIDFDAARNMHPDCEQDTRLLGTRGYAPPEQYGFAQTDERADLYALGVTFRELLGQCAGKSRWKRILNRCTAIEPKRRYRRAWQIRWAIISGRIRRRILYPIFTLLIALSSCFMLWSYTTDLDVREAVNIVLSSQRKLIFGTVDLSSIERSDDTLSLFSGEALPIYQQLTLLQPGKTFISTGYADENGNLLFGGFSETYDIDTGKRYYRAFDGLYTVTADMEVHHILPEHCTAYAPAVRKLYQLSVFDTPWL